MLGIVLLVIAQRWDYRRLRALAPVLVLVSLGLLVAVLVIGAGGERRAALDLGRPGRLPAVRAREARARDLGRRATSRAARRRARSSELARPIGAARRRSSPCCSLAEPDLGTAIALVLMLAAMLLVAGHAVRACSALALAIAGALGTLAIWLEPYRRARFFAFLHPWHDAQGTGFQIVQAMIGMGSGGIFGVGLGQGVAEDLLPARGAHRHDAREHRRGARPRRRHRRDRSPTCVFAYAGLQDRARLPRPVRQAARRRADRARLRPGGGQHRGRDGASRR